MGTLHGRTGVVAWLIAAAGPATATPADPDQPLPCLQASTGNRLVARPTVDRAVGPRLALSGVSEERRLELARDLEALAAHYERRRNPLFVPLAQDDSAALGKVMPWLALISAGMGLAIGRWESVDGDLVLRPVARCAPGARCVRLTIGLAGDDEERRWRFMAWPLAYAAIVRAPSDDEAARVADHLRAGTRQDSKVALVLTAADIHAPRSSPGRQAVARAASRLGTVMRELHVHSNALLDDLVLPATKPEELRWLKLPAGAIVVLPHLAGLSQPKEFVAEVRKRLATAGGKVEWLAAPAAP